MRPLCVFVSFLALFLSTPSFAPPPVPGFDNTQYRIEGWVMNRATDEFSVAEVQFEAGLGVFPRVLLTMTGWYITLRFAIPNADWLALLGLPVGLGSAYLLEKADNHNHPHTLGVKREGEEDFTDYRLSSKDYHQLFRVLTGTADTFVDESGRASRVKVQRVVLTVVGKEVGIWLHVAPLDWQNEPGDTMLARLDQMKVSARGVCKNILRLAGLRK